MLHIYKWYKLDDNIDNFSTFLVLTKSKSQMPVSFERDKVYKGSFLHLNVYRQGCGFSWETNIYALICIYFMLTY